MSTLLAPPRSPAPPAPPIDPPKGVGGGGSNDEEPEEDRPIPWLRLTMASVLALVFIIFLAVGFA